MAGLGSIGLINNNIAYLCHFRKAQVTCDYQFKLMSHVTKGRRQNSPLKVAEGLKLVGDGHQLPPTICSPAVMAHHY